MDKNEKALKHAQNVWGIYFDEIDEDCNSTKGENSQSDYLAGYNQCEQDNDKLKQEHAEMLEMLEMLQKELNGYNREKAHDELEQLLNKIKENEN
jgi:uncharacterized FlaG/YvyC family protein